MFENKPWKNWTTRKVTLICSIIAVCAYTIIDIIMTFFDKPLDATLTEQVFIYFTALPISGCAITIAKVVKGKTNSDADETLLHKVSEFINIESEADGESEAEDDIDLAREQANENVKEISETEEQPFKKSNKPERIVKGEFI